MSVLVVHPSDTKIAIVVQGVTEGDLEVRATYALEQLGYTIYAITEHPTQPIVASQVIVLFVGHAVSDYTDLMYTITGEFVHLAGLLVMISTSELLLLTTTCYGGGWLKYAQEGRIIISNVNDTLSYYIESYPSPSIVELLEYMQYGSVETSFSIWKRDVLEFSMQTGNWPQVEPIMYDGIEGDTYF